MGLQAGDTFGRYELVSWLGRGGMAETWRAQLMGAAGVTKSVLIKKVLPEYADDEAFISMFISEARISATLSHGNVAQVFDFGRVDGEYFLAMEFVDGQPLHRVLKRAMKSGMAALPTPVAVFIAMEMCRGLHYAHTRTDGSGTPLDIVHRDISPDNVLVGYEGQIKIVDFGIAKAKLLRGVRTEPGVVKGKYLFFSPEQARGEEVDARTDVWATGVVLYELLCGRLPVDGAPQVVMSRVARGEVPALNLLRPDLPKELNDIVMKALTPDRDQRFESSHAFGEALAGFLYSNYPRFSSLSVAHLLRVLFRKDLVQSGRQLAVPGTFQEEMKSWGVSSVVPEPVAPAAPEGVQTRRIARAAKPPNTALTDTTEPDPPALPNPPSRRMLYGLGAGGLVAVGAGLWFLLGSPSHPAVTEAPPPTPARTVVAVETPASVPPSPSPTVQEELVAAVPTEPAEEPEVEKPAPPGRKATAKTGRVSKSSQRAQAAEPPVEPVPEVPVAVAASNLQETAPSAPEPVEAIQPETKQSVFGLIKSKGQEAQQKVSQLVKLKQQEFQLKVSGLVQTRQYDSALEVANDCAKSHPTMPECQLMLGLVHGKLNHPRESTQHYEKFLALAPADHPRRAEIVALLGNAR
ncbi:serine/threonine protein kinase [Corallococcus sicarius]|uniref:Serine/threonine protein kinase n=1 Tax=Corallococcus sicarius TaxID=2316726 RepID=A0A3A8N071_9BACT|nr:serine/threonine-protein kinase [Corallococcus sicarius]RKH37867.1 serine/threonine protein kinase [Corallococcus sicarius]